MVEAVTRINFPYEKGDDFVLNIEFSVHHTHDCLSVYKKKADLKDTSKKVTNQLLKLLESALPPALHGFLARSLVSLFSAGEYSCLLETVNKCNDIIKNKDEVSATKL